MELLRRGKGTQAFQLLDDSPFLNCDFPFQACGLQELKQAHYPEALRYLESAVLLDERLAPIMSWQDVKKAKELVQSSPRQ